MCNIRYVKVFSYSKVRLVQDHLSRHIQDNISANLEALEMCFAVSKTKIKVRQMQCQKDKLGQKNVCHDVLLSVFPCMFFTKVLQASSSNSHVNLAHCTYVVSLLRC